jgi:hypothetical protein
MFFEVVLLDMTLLSAIFPHIDRKKISNGKFDFHMLLFVLWCLSKIIYIIYKNNKMIKKIKKQMVIDKINKNTLNNIKNNKNYNNKKLKKYKFNIKKFR